MLHLGPIWYHSEPSDVPYSQNLTRPISWFGLFLQQNDSRKLCIVFYVSLIRNLEYEKKLHTHYAYMTLANWLHHTDLFALFYCGKCGKISS